MKMLMTETTQKSIVDFIRENDGRGFTAESVLDMVVYQFGRKFDRLEVREIARREIKRIQQRSYANA